jgi:DNA topoisomerase-2
MLFIRCDIENPTFDSQTKDYMTTPSSKFGSTCEVSNKFIEKIAKLGVMDAACALTEVKDNKAAKKTDGNKSKTIRGIHKLVDANDAGTANSSECTLLLVEGDSAKAGTVSGLSKDDRRTIGVYPLRGKLMNVRGEKTKKINENKEIADIKQILGLETGKKYTPESAKEKLRYGHVIFLTDQDLDGIHIKALCVNLFDSEWATLLAIPGFIGFMNTPILKARKGQQELIFYNDGEYEQWKKTSPDTTGWNIKYYKGLGTSTAKEFKEYFAKKKIVSFNCSGTECKNAIDMVFNKKRSLERKEWLEAYDRSLYMNTDIHNVTYKEFVNNEMIHFSKYDCDRSIPNIMDGLKTSQRKILFAAFKRNLKSEIKVAQFSGYVSEHSAYHHGEQSLNGAIVNMAQDYVGSNNVNLFIPNGQFGTRLQGGNDSASERYIFTQLNPLTRLIFRQEDDVILRYLDDDGTSVEPVWYAPIIPMILINGSKGIGTGFSTDVPSFNPIQIVTYMKNKLTNQNTACDIEPYYEGFKGTVTKIMPYKYLIKGVYEIINSKQVRITELPIGCWTDDYKEYLEKLIEGDGKKRGSIVKDYTDMSTDCLVDITITFAVGKINELATKSEGYGCTTLDKLLKIYTTQTTTNMHMFDHEEKLRKFASPQDIIDYYMNVRFNVYTNRKKTQLAILKQEITKLSNKAKFILENLNDTIDLRRKKNTEVSVLLEKHGYDIIDNDKAYKYLVRMPMDSVTEENVKLLMNDRDSKQTEFALLEATTETQMWINELDYFLEQYTTYQKKRVEIMYETSTSTSKHKGKGKNKSIRKKHYTFGK